MIRYIMELVKETIINLFLKLFSKPVKVDVPVSFTTQIK